MKYLAITGCLLGLVMPVASHAVSPERVGLEGAWRLTQTDRNLSLPATVPGVVQTDLMAAGKISDPFYRDNNKSSQWVKEVPWSYARSFTVSAGFLKHRQIRLRCEGLDTLATIQVNGKLVAHTDNMFRTWEFDVRPLLHTGDNKIQVVFAPVAPYLEAHVNQAAFPGKPVETHGMGYLRKSPFQPGWDFAPELMTSGIWKKIGLIGWDEARLTDVGVIQDHRSPGRVGLRVEVAADTSAPVKAHVAVLFQGRKVTEADTSLAGGKSISKLTIARPQLWWPVGMGAQNLYDIQVELRDARGAVVDQKTQRFGLHTITWMAKTSKRPLTLAINGRPFFAKGSNWVPEDSLTTRANPARQRRLIDDAINANMNMMRLWGGGYYDGDAFYDEADKRGLLLWSEFKFADASYPAFDPAWMANVKAEAQDNVRRLRNHPSLVVWSGNNEVIGFVADKTDPNHMTHEDYNKLFHGLLADVVRDLSPDAVYTPGSPEAGDDHDWNVWHGSSGFESYRDVHGFMSEFGFQAFPQPRSVQQFTTAADRASVLSPVMEYHQRNWRDGNQLILSTAKRYYRNPKDFDSALWLSQIQQADGVLTGVEHWRRDWPNSTGSLVWQYNDCWPSISWSMMDYYGRPKALWYRIRHAYAPVMLSGQTDGAEGNAQLWVSSDVPKPLRGNVRWALMRMDGTTIEKGMQPVAIPAGTTSVRALSLAKKAAVAKEGAGALLLWSELSVPGQPISTAVLTFAKPKNMTLAAPNIRAKVAQAGQSYRVTLTATRPALFSWLDLAGMDARFSDNFVHLRPGAPLTITLTPAKKTDLAHIQKALQVRSLYDTYVPGAPATLTVTPKPDGTIVATADDADVDGDAALEIGAPNNIGTWADPKTSLLWTVKDVKSGAYTVSMNVACPADEAGSKFVVDVAGQELPSAVPTTGGWTTYIDLPLGTVNVTNSGTIKITLKPTNMQHTRVMNLRSLTLTPASK
ncbi:MAG: glycoside hydrolase family 2 protein [Capsulimonas sp.]|nr:glycoside hydrolase family 2 protein [Capsulimonas sp.]